MNDSIFESWFTVNFSTSKISPLERTPVSKAPLELLNRGCQLELGRLFLQIFMYHAVLPDEETEPLFSFGQVHRAAFYKQMKHLKKHTKILPLSEAVAALKSGMKISDQFSVITFDDGYKNNLEVALPVLEELQIPATFFIATAHSYSNKLLWFSRLTAEAYVRSKISDSKKSKLKLLNMLNSGFSDKDPAKTVAEDFGADIPAGLTEDRLRFCLLGMSPKDIEILSSSPLVELGGHTVNHPRLSQLSEEGIEEEILKNKEALEQIAKRKVRFFAYPEANYDARVIKIVERLGFEAACGVNKESSNESLFELSRIGIYSDSFLTFYLKSHGLNRNSILKSIKICD